MITGSGDGLKQQILEHKIIPFMFDERNKEKQDENVGQKNDDSANSADHTIDN